MNDGKNLRFDHFLDYETWREACKLLEAQIQYLREGKGLYRNLPFYYYKRIPDDNRAKLGNKPYYQSVIASNLFFALEKEFFWHEYSLPKPGIAIRKYTFYSYPMLSLYYAVGLYLLRLSAQLNEDVKRDNKDQLYTFYGGNLQWDNSGSLCTKYYEHLHYWDQHAAFRAIVASEQKGEPSKERVIIELDIQNYFENAYIDILLRNLERFVKPSIKRSLNFDASAQESIRFFFQYLNKGAPAIIQSYSNNISGYLGYLYLLFGDLAIFEHINAIDTNRQIVQDYKVIRYMDDTFLSLTFVQGISNREKKRIILGLLNAIAQTYYEDLNLRFNKKFGLYFMDNEEDKKKLFTRLNYTSIEMTPEDTDVEVHKEELGSRENGTKEKVEKDQNEQEDPKEKAEAILKLLDRIKQEGIDFLYQSFAGRIEKYKEEVDEVLKYSYDRNMDNIFKSLHFQERLEQVFKSFPFEVFRLNSKAFTVLVFKTSKALEDYRNFLLEIKAVTVFDAYLIHDYITQVNIKDEELIKKLQVNDQWKPIVEAFKGKSLFPDQDYCGVGKEVLQIFEKDINIIEQIRLRRHHENLKEYTPGLNHLLNEFHAICRVLDEQAGTGKNYDVNKVVKYLKSERMGSQALIEIRNLFDRRNKNPISHPGEDKLAAWAVLPEEYVSYKQVVLRCIFKLLKSYKEKEKTKKKAIASIVEAVKIFTSAKANLIVDNQSIYEDMEEKIPYKEFEPAQVASSQKSSIDLDDLDLFL